MQYEFNDACLRYEFYDIMSLIFDDNLTTYIVVFVCPKYIYFIHCIKTLNFNSVFTILTRSLHFHIFFHTHLDWENTDQKERWEMKSNLHFVYEFYDELERSECSVSTIEQKKFKQKLTYVQHIILKGCVIPRARPDAVALAKHATFQNDTWDISYSRNHL